MGKIISYVIIFVILIVAVFVAVNMKKGTTNFAMKGLSDKGVLVDQLPKSDEEKKTASKDDLIKVTTPQPNAAITSPITITGLARGTWYFEASFPIQLVDDQGQVVTTTIAQAGSDWMTEEFVNFSATLNFPAGPNKQGKLILKKDNPSGLPVNDDQLVLPVIY